MGQTNHKIQLSTSPYGPNHKQHETQKDLAIDNKFEQTKVSIFEKGGPINHKTGKLLNRPFSGYKPKIQ